MILYELEEFEKRHGFRCELGVSLATYAAYTALAASAAGGVMAYKSAKDQAAATTMAASYNATAQENQATQGANFGRENVRRTISSGNRFLATQRASLGSSGVVGSTGSPLLAMAYNAGEARLRALEASQQSSAAYGAGLARAGMTRYEGALEAKGYKRRATASLISTAGQLASSGYAFRDAGNI